MCLGTCSVSFPRLYVSWFPPWFLNKNHASSSFFIRSRRFTYSSPFFFVIRLKYAFANSKYTHLFYLKKRTTCHQIAPFLGLSLWSFNEPYGFSLCLNPFSEITFFKRTATMLFDAVISSNFISPFFLTNFSFCFW